MTPPSFLIALTAFVAVGTGVAVHLAARGRLPRNRILGIRTAPVQRDDSTWVRGHRAAVVPTWTTAVVVVALAAGALEWESWSSALTSIAVAVLLVGALIGTTLANRAARRPPRR